LAYDVAQQEAAARGRRLKRRSHDFFVDVIAAVALIDLLSM
jgi:hypothetical protein